MPHALVFCLIIASFMKISNDYFNEIRTFVKVIQFQTERIVQSTQTPSSEDSCLRRLGCFFAILSRGTDIPQFTACIRKSNPGWLGPTNAKQHHPNQNGAVCTVFTSYGSRHRRSSFRRYRQAACKSHPDHCGSPQPAQSFHSQRTDLFSQTNTHFLGMTITAANRLRVSDASAPLDYSGSLFRKNPALSSAPLGEYGIRRIPFHFPLAARKPSPQSTHIRALGKNRRNRITVALLPHPGFVPPHPDIFCNNALDHLITDYAVSCVLQQQEMF